MFEELRVKPQDERKNYVDLNIHNDGEILEALRIVMMDSGTNPDTMKKKLNLSKVGTMSDIKKVAEHFELAFFMDTKEGATRIFYKEDEDEAEEKEEESSEPQKGSGDEVDLP
jgi:hypothetical protein